MYMRASDGSSEETPTPPNQSAVILLLGTMADTTWRMFLPTLGGTGLGLWADNGSHTGPLWTLVGLGIGIVITSLLVRQQLTRVKQDDK
jgi:hypothetical protein